jgi:diketogulonate reductase-like aldo/keto reductase
MNIPVKKLKNGFAMPVFGLGTWQMGGRTEHDLQNDDEKDIRAIRDAIDSGITHIDTAEVYAGGYSEILIGKALEGYDRSKIFLASKVQSANFAYDDIIKSCEESLKRLKTDYLDLYLMHIYSNTTPLKDSIRALDYLVSKGKVRNIGVCNFGKERLAEAQSYSKNKIVCDQVHYNLMFREPEHKGLLEYCQKNDVFLVAWRPLSKGKLLEGVPDVVRVMCEKYKKTPAQIAINWLLAQPNVLTLSKMGSVTHLQENLGAVGWEMDAVDIEILRREFPNQQVVSDLTPLDEQGPAK